MKQKLLSLKEIRKNWWWKRKEILRDVKTKVDWPAVQPVKENRAVADWVKALKGKSGCYIIREAKGFLFFAGEILYIARQILAGEFDGCDNSTRESLTIGLRSISHPLANRSLEKLNFNSRKI